MKKQGIILSLIIALVLCIYMATVSFAASTTLYFSENEVELGDTVTVTVTFRGDDIAGVMFNIDYDTSVLTYKSASGSGSTSYNGGKAVSNLDSGTTDSYSVDLVFTANAKGSSQISVNGVKVSDGNGDAISGFDGASARLNVVSAETTTEKQEEKTTEKEETTSAKEETTTKSQSEKPGEITLGSKTYTLVDDSAFVDAPDGFDETYSDYNGNRILTYTSKDKAQQIVPVIDADNHRSFLLFDDEKDIFSEFIEIKSAALPIILIAAKDGIIPEGFTPVNVKIGDNEILAYENEEFKENGICLIYGLNTEEGKANLYIYDTKDGTLQKYFNVNTPEAKPAETTKPAEEVETTEAVSDFESNIPLSKSTMIKIICAVSVMLLAAVIAVLTLAIKLKNKNSNEEDEEIVILSENEDEDENDPYYTE
mgnify:CR=1 FL=1